MQHAALAYALRQRQHAFGQVPDEMIEALSDDAIIDSYITCSCCGRKQVTPQCQRLRENVGKWAV
jgi:hypothetical protein